MLSTAQRRPGTTSLLELTADVACLQLSIVNVYFVGPPGGPWVLLDAGLHFSHRAILDAAAERYGPASRPAAIVLTHGHFDHVGTLPDLAERWDVPVFAHPLEHPYLSGQSSYPPPDPAVGGGAMSLLSRLYPRGPIHLARRLRSLPADGSVPSMPGWRWVHTPGHAPGHVAFFRDADRTLIAGDAFVTTVQESAWAVLTRRQEVHRPPAYYTIDWEAARRSVAAIAALRPEIAATGHGIPMAGDLMRRQLDALVRDWDRVAVPPQGRYVRQPAVTDGNGVRSVPPPVLDRQLLVVAGLAAGALLGTHLLRSSRS